MGDPPVSDFEKASAAPPQEGVFREFWYFLKTNKKWWLIPILFFMLLFGVLLMLAGSPVAPLIYSFF